MRLLQNVFAFAKLRLVFLLIIFICTIYILRSTFIALKDNFAGPTFPHIQQTTSWELLIDHAPEKDVKYRTVNRNLRNVGVAESIEEYHYYLNIRKLIVFAVSELNRGLKFTKCAKWWANPLDLSSHEEKSKSQIYTDHLIRFLIQPGNLLARVVIRQLSPPIRIQDKELEILGMLEIEKSFESNPCDSDENLMVLNEDAKNTCLCSFGQKANQYKHITTQLRTMWASSDKELDTWTPEKSFSVGDYMNFTDYQCFLHSPGNTTQEFAKLNYSKEYCGPDVKMLVMISSAPGHFKHRKIIRETYASSKNLEGKGIKVVFLMGVPGAAKLNKELKQEAEIFKDIIQANFVDSYHNLTLSHLSMYKWAYLTCINGKDKGVTPPSFILKADDDYLLNVDLALKIAQQNKEYELIGCLYCNTKTIRSPSFMHKYYTPRYMHISNSYPGYLSGIAYLLRTDAIPRLLHISTTTPMIHMDDVYVSGILPRQLKIYPRASLLFSYKRTEPDACETKKVVSSLTLNPEDLIVQWKKLNEPTTAHCDLEDLQIKVPELSAFGKRVCLFE